jgi:hypothetical protein
MELRASGARYLYPNYNPFAALAYGHARTFRLRLRPLMIGSPFGSLYSLRITATRLERLRSPALNTLQRR